ncbi:DUF924 family protein [Methylopila turkensis]|uniref:DUF924 domain-containing protein n=1 Tax=Methylopila turkensis TaxID=1437816 RepID=A0A9W6JLZ1_9HYPH|nr:DUF924 family protein [Methylopila turkensis]GLK78861.1 hypothetical protein GCM10008174_06020 [Methylopila turkensis]
MRIAEAAPRRRGAPREALAVVAFWRAAGRPRWFAKDVVFDRMVRARLGRLRDAAAAGALDHWADTAPGALALLILLDQAPRNLFRGHARAFATDALAVEVARRAVARGFDRRTARPMRSFFYLPFEHAEDHELQALCVRLFSADGDRDGLAWAQLHADIIARFGRFPHRNAALGRDTTDHEREYLENDGFDG